MFWLRPLLLSLVLTGVAHAVDEAPLEPEGDNGAGQDAPQTTEAAPPETPDQSADGEENGPEAADNPVPPDGQQMPAPEEAPAEDTRPAARPVYLSQVDIGDVITLEAGGEPFFGLRAEETTGAPLGAVILVPDRGTHPDWPDVTGPLRRGLLATGWTTLAIEAPAEPSRNGDVESYLVQSRERIRAAATLLHSEGHARLALIGHGTGAMLAANYAANASDGLVGGLVLVGIAEPVSDKEPRIYGLLRRNELPVLDIFGSRGLAATLDGAQRRAEAGRRGAVTLSPHGARYTATRGSVAEADRFRGMRYRQLRVVGADQGFSGFEATLIRRVRGWLGRHVEEQTSPIVAAGSEVDEQPPPSFDEASAAAPGEQPPPMFQDQPSGEQPPPMFQQGVTAENGAPPPTFDGADADETPPASPKGETNQ